MRLYLKLNDSRFVEVDVDDASESVIELNYFFNSLENPTDYISEYAQDITLPKTAKNNKIFDEYRIIDSKFSQNERIEYVCISNGDAISNGECYISSITRDSYVLTMCGALSVIFNKLLNSGWSNIDDDEYYRLQEYWNGVMLNSNTVTVSFATDNINFDFATVKAMTNQLNKFCNIAGFAPTIGVDSGSFETGKWLTNNNILPVGDTTETTQHNYNTEGLTSQQMAEFRCYQTRPYVYVVRLWQIYSELCEEITGYRMVLDGRWFNDNYEYLRGLVYMLPMINNESDENTNQYTLDLRQNISSSNWNTWANYGFRVESPYTITAGGINRGTFEWSIPVSFDLAGSWNIDERQNHFIFNPEQYFFVNCKITNGTDVYVNRNYIYLPLPDYKRDDGKTYQYSPTQEQISSLESMCDRLIMYRYRTSIESYLDGSNWRAKINVGEITGNIYLNDITNAHVELGVQVVDFSTGDKNPMKIMRYTKSLLGERVEIVNVAGSTSGRFVTTAIVNNTLTVYNAGGALTLGKMFGSVKPFSVLLKISKMLGLIWLVDDDRKVVNVYRRSDYFHDCFNVDMSAKSPSVFPYIGFYDCTNIADFSDYELRPLSWSDRNVIFNFAETENEYGKKYFDKYGMAYGSSKIITDNRISNTTKNLLSTNENNIINPPIFVSEWVTPIFPSGKPATYKKKDSPYLYDGENTFCYRLKNGEYSKETRVNNYRIENDKAYVLITNDTQIEMDKKEFCWHKSQEINDNKTTVKPIFSEANENGYCILFGKPKEIYTDSFPTVKNTKLLTDEWIDYLEEVYDINNKTLIINMAINAQLYNRLKIVPFVTIGNVSYIVLSIEGFTGTGFCKVTLRQLTNLFRLFDKSKSKNSTEDVTKDIWVNPDIPIHDNSHDNEWGVTPIV